VQILVYAGAVMVLFLFIIMLLDLRAEQMRKPRAAAYIGGGGIAAGFIIILLQVLSRFEAGGHPLPALSEGAADDVKSLGLLLFTDYNLPFQIVGVLILVASIGVVVLSKRDLS
jgi:NADH-quinone oxidoreductase subunit J